jgi:membrane-bound lytic murein transglycosylase B
VTLRIPDLAMLFITALALPTWPAQNAAKTKPAPRAKLVKTTQAAAAAGAASYATRDDVMRQADDMAQRRDLDPAGCAGPGQARHLPNVSRLMQPPPRAPPRTGAVYRSRFIDPIRIRAGVRLLASEPRHAGARRQA